MVAPTAVKPFERPVEMVIRVAVNNLITFNPRVWASWIIATSLNWIFKLKWIEWTSEISGVILCLNLVECYGINNVDDVHVYTGHIRIARAGWCPVLRSKAKNAIFDFNKMNGKKWYLIQSVHHHLIWNAMLSMCSLDGVSIDPYPRWDSLSLSH